MSKYKQDDDEDEDFMRKPKKKESPRRRPDRNQKRSWDEEPEVLPPLKIPHGRRFF